MLKLGKYLMVLSLIFIRKEAVTRKSLNGKELGKIFVSVKMAFIWLDL